MPEVEFRRARPQDFSAILKLQSDNYIGNLAVEERKEGFLSAEFTPEQVAALADDIGIIVAVESHSVLGYLCGSRCDFNHRSPIVAKMLEAFNRVHFQGKPLSSHKTFIYGPVCIDRAHRSRGLLPGLYGALKGQAAREFEVGVAFVARNNPRSLRAHGAGLNMTEVGEFEVNGNVYVILAFNVR